MAIACRFKPGLVLRLGLRPSHAVWTNAGVGKVDLEAHCYLYTAKMSKVQLPLLLLQSLQTTRSPEHPLVLYVTFEFQRLVDNSLKLLVLLIVLPTIPCRAHTDIHKDNL